MPSEPLKICNSCRRKFLTPDEFLSNTSRWRICDQGHLWYNCSCHSTGIILKGKFDWYNPSQQLSANAQSIFNKISSQTQLPHLPNYVMELQRMMEDPNATAEQMAKLVKYDSLLAATILRVANNQKIRDGQQIKSLSHAIVFIGVDSLRDMVLIAAVSRFQLKTRVFSGKDFWEKAFFTGRIAEFLVEKLNLEFTAELAFLAGSTCNIGKIVQAIIDPITADSYASELSNMDIMGNWTDAEQRHKGYDHSVLGEIGGALWGFPEELLESIALHHQSPRLAKTRVLGLWEVAAFANQLSHWVIPGENHQMDSRLFKELALRFKISPELLDTFQTQLDGMRRTQLIA